MNKFEKTIAGIVLTVVLTGLFAILIHIFVGKPNAREINSLNTEIESLADKVEEAKKAPALIVSYQNKINALIGGSEENSNLLNKKIDVPTVLNMIENSAATSGLGIGEISFNGNASFVKGGLIEKEDGTTTEIVNTENFYLLEIKLKIQSGYAQLWNFLKSCEGAGYYITTDHISVSASKNSGTMLDGEIQVNIYSIVNDEMTEKAGKANEAVV